MKLCVQLNYYQFKIFILDEPIVDIMLQFRWPGVYNLSAYYINPSCKVYMSRGNVHYIHPIKWESWEGGGVHVRHTLKPSIHVYPITEILYEILEILLSRT